MSESKLCELQNTIYYFTNKNTKNWKTVLECSNAFDLTLRRKFMWVWPTENDFQKIKTAFHLFGINRILSIGCGSGLLEWLFKETIGLEIFGLEVDKMWWWSPYSIKNFIDLNFAEDTNLMDGAFLQTCCRTKTWDFSLLFCYFNNRDAFLNYLRHYEGASLIVVGPIPNAGIHTDPDPSLPNIPETHGMWKLCHKYYIEDRNILTIYKRT